MAASSPVALILGAGANIGQNVGRAFAAKGYKIALAARSLKEDDSTSEQLHIKSDFSDPESISKIFAKVTSKFGTPHVVVYNGTSSLTVSDKRSWTHRMNSGSCNRAGRKGPFGPASGCLQSRLCHQCNQRFCGRPASSSRLCEAPRVCISHLHLHG